MKNKRGFTLVEMLVVVSIIGILSTVAVVNLNSARTRAKEASVKSWVKTLTSAAILCNDQGGYILAPATAPYVGSEAFCSTVSDLTWPAKLPSGYTTVTIVDSQLPADAYDGIWTITVATSGDYDGYECSESGCQIP